MKYAWFLLTAATLAAIGYGIHTGEIRFYPKWQMEARDGYVFVMNTNRGWEGLVVCMPNTETKSLWCVGNRYFNEAVKRGLVTQ